MTDVSKDIGITYKDDDLVYVDPETKTVVGIVEFEKNDQPKSLPYKPAALSPEKIKAGERPKGFWRKMHPWGTYRSMKRIFKVEGKIKDPEPNKTLEEVLPRALAEAFWEWK
jgi:hypothetical protein